MSRQKDMADMESLGQVFSDEDSTTDYDSDANDDFDSHSGDSFEDELDYEMWRRYNRK